VSELVQMGAGGPGPRAARRNATRVQLALSDFMDAVVIVDPAEYQRRPDEPERPLGFSFLWTGSKRSGARHRG